MWDVITYPFPNFNGSTVEVWEGTTNYIHALLCMWLFIHVGIAANCRYCEEGFPPELETDTRGLYKDEALEVVWMIYPPRATGLDPLRRAQWMKCEDTGAKFIGKIDWKTVEQTARMLATSADPTTLIIHNSDVWQRIESNLDFMTCNKQFHITWWNFVPTIAVPGPC